jgi:hypothetical protein
LVTRPIGSASKTCFVVYAKPPFGGPERVLAYLARSTHRTAIANSRLVAVDEDEVVFSYKDYRRGGRGGVMRLAPHEFIRRFLLHVLPDGFHRIRQSVESAQTTSKPASDVAPGSVWTMPVYGPDGVRHRGGAILFQAFAWNCGNLRIPTHSGQGLNEAATAAEVEASG